METKTFEVPALYGDHHVTEVRRILLEMEGVQEVYASSAFHLIEVKFDPRQVTTEDIRARLSEAGYLEEIPVLTETGVASARKAGDAAFRHSMVYETTRTTVSFSQRVDPAQRPLWPCPGLGMVRADEEADHAQET